MGHFRLMRHPRGGEPWRPDPSGGMGMEAPGVRCSPAPAVARTGMVCEGVRHMAYHVRTPVAGHMAAAWTVGLGLAVKEIAVGEAAA